MLIFKYPNKKLRLTLFKPLPFIFEYKDVMLPKISQAPNYMWRYLSYKWGKEKFK